MRTIFLLNRCEGLFSALSRPPFSPGLTARASSLKGSLHVFALSSLTGEAAPLRGGSVLRKAQIAQPGEARRGRSDGMRGETVETPGAGAGPGPARELITNATTLHEHQERRRPLCLRALKR